MPGQTTPHALVTVLTVEPYNRLHVETFEVEAMLRPVWVSEQMLYTDRVYREGYSVRDLLMTLPVDVATWLHRSGQWDQLELEP